MLTKTVTENTFASFTTKLCVASIDELQNSIVTITQGMLCNHTSTNPHLQNKYTCAMSNTLHLLQVYDTEDLNIVTTYIP